MDWPVEDAGESEGPFVMKGILRHEVGGVFVTPEYRDVTQCFAIGILPKRASSGKPPIRVLVGCDAFGTMYPHPGKGWSPKREWRWRLLASRWSGPRMGWYG
jgi:hypothetical protein